MPRAKETLNKNVTSSQDKTSPRCEPHCVTIARHLDVPEHTYKKKRISMAHLARDKSEVHSKKYKCVLESRTYLGSKSVKTGFCKMMTMLMQCCCLDVRH